MLNLRRNQRQAARDRTSWLARSFGQELRIARVTAGLSQARVAALADIGQTAVSRAERGDTRVSLDIRCRLAAACGHEIGWRLYPVSTISLRDSGQLAIGQFITRAAHSRWFAQLEVPVAPNDARAADLLLSGTDETLHIEIERLLIDVQAQLRLAQRKRQALAADDPKPVRLILAVPDSRLVRQRLAPAADLLARALPVPSAEIWRAIRAGTPVGGDGILFVRQRTSSGRSHRR